MLKTGKGLSYLPLFVVEKDIKEGKIAKLDVKDIDITMYRQVFYHANKYMTKEMEKFVEYCKFWFVDSVACMSQKEDKKKYL